MDYFNISHLSVERLLSTWKWLSPQEMALVARNAFGDLFLRDNDGAISKLDISVGEFKVIATSEERFRHLAATPEMRESWFAEKDEIAAAKQGFQPTQTQCIAFKIPLIFEESAEAEDNVYVGDIYDYVGYLGDLNRQLSGVQNGEKVKVIVAPEPGQDDPA